MSEPFIAEIKMFAGNFAPRGYAFCAGQLMSIAQNTALFSLVGTTYGGDGRTTFGLPDLRGRVPVGVGQGPGLSSMQLGEKAGEPTNTLNTNQIPSHTHTIGASNAAGTSTSPAGSYPAASSARDNQYAASANATMNAGALSNSGGSQPHNNMQPYLGMNFIIALQGIFPSRN